MPMKQKGRKIYRTMQGKQIDLDLLIKRNELTPAVGNAKVNARGDELGAGGKIIRKREEVVKDYYKGNKPVVNEEAVSQDRKSAPVEKPAAKVTAAEQKMLDEFDSEPVPPKKTTSTKSTTTAKEEWVEDEEGNFVKKGD
jgi:hypothetical protein